MSRFDRYLLSQLLALFGFFALVLVAVYWINRAVGLFDKLLGDGQSALVFLEFSLLVLPNAIRLVLPVAAFAAAVYVTNRLMQESELVVMQATGFSSFRLARAVLQFGVAVTLLHFVLMNLLVPWSNAMLTDRSREMSQDMTARFMNAGQFMHPSPKVTLYIRDITPEGELRGVFLSDDRSTTSSTIYNASRALILRSDTGPRLLMLDGTSQRLDKDAARRLSITRFADATYDLGGMMNAEKAKPSPPRDITTFALLQQRNDPAVADEIRTELHARISQPLLSLSSALLGFATLMVGGYSRFGLWRQIVGAVLAVIVVQLVSTAAMAVALEDAKAWPILYLAPALGCGLSGVLLWWAQRPRTVRAVTQ